MTSTLRHTISSATALGLVSFTITSALVSGMFAMPTLVAFSLLSVYGVLEIAIASYAAPHVFTPVRRPAPVRVVRPSIARVSALVEYPAVTRACSACAA